MKTLLLPQFHECNRKTQTLQITQYLKFLESEKFVSFFEFMIFKKKEDRKTLSFSLFPVFSTQIWAISDIFESNVIFLNKFLPNWLKNKKKGLITKSQRSLNLCKLHEYRRKIILNHPFRWNKAYLNSQRKREAIIPNNLLFSVKNT